MESIKRITTTALAVVLVMALAAPSLAGTDRTRLRAELSAPAAAGDISGKADFESRDGRSKFSVSVEGLVPGSSFDVMVAGAVVGSMTIDDFGMGALDLDTTAQVDDLDLPFPPNFPNVNAGTLVQVGQLTGTLQAK
ncbi:MAG: hypothetical protein ACE5FC_04225 [Myxococcota bacterium]